MRLVKLTLSGFKSFADKTEFTFDEPIIGVVGPNGCGKSNIVDAIKWVLGERSSKSLRGKEMTDVIFAGSAGRKPSGAASVTLTFENPIEEMPLALRIAAEQAAALEAKAADASSTQTAVATVEAGSTEQPAPTSSNDPGGLDEEASEVVFDRSGTHKRGLPIDEDIVEVERRLYRDGASQYLINGKRARLKDIRDLFLDTGIGADAYSIIEQGKVDAMLLASPQERRTIFEEAAGIAKYKQRRIESQRKLERAQANLALTREQLTNTERRLRMVRGQAVKARRFKELDAELRAWRLALAFELYDDLRQRLTGLTSRLAELEGSRRGASELVASLEAQKLETEQVKQQRASDLRDVQQQRQQAELTHHAAQQRQQVATRALNDGRQRMQRDQSRKAESEARREQLRTSQQEHGETIGELSETLASAERTLSEATQARASILQELNDRRRQQDERRSAWSRLDRELAGLSVTIQTEANRAQSLEQEIGKLDQRLAPQEALATACAAKLSESRQTAEAGLVTVASLETKLQETTQREATLSTDRRSMAESLSSVEQQWIQVDTRRAAIEAMVKARVGLGEVTRAVLEAKDESRGFAGVIAPLADLIDADPADAEMIERALGADLQALVVSAMSSMPTADERASLPGRGTFLPLVGLGVVAATTEPAIDGQIATSDQSREVETNGRVSAVRVAAHARAGLEPDVAKQVESLLDRLLGNTMLVESIDAAMLIGATEPSRGLRFILGDGTVVEADGRLIGGPHTMEKDEASETPGILQRRRDLEQLTQESSSLKGTLVEGRERLARADADVSALAEEQSRLRMELSTAQRSLIAAQGRTDQAQAESERLARESASMAEQRQAAAKKLEDLTELQRGLREKGEKLRLLLDDQTASLQTTENDLRTIQGRSEAENERIAAARVEVGRVSEKLNATRREHRRMESMVEDAAREIASLTESLEHAQASLGEHEAVIEEARLQGEAAMETMRSLDASLGELQTLSQQAGEAALAAGEKLLASREQALRVERDWHALEVAKRELEVKRENLEQRTGEDLQVELAMQYAEYATMMADTEGGSVARIDVTQAQAQVDTHKSELSKLGNVNLDAIEEETQLEGRNEELIRQVADIDDATTKLTELIAQLNEASRSRFAGVFTAIQEHFAGQGGMFRKLFGGGQAQVRLMPLIKEVETPEGIKRVETQETDLLESGIEIIAKPPGKEPRSISQLSGGEKTLTAVALLLAIFKSKPSCFCILDEVDAALDEGNVSRYCGVVREFTTHSHFIVITHNKKTMQAADRLYGVTMQERGVSTRVTVKLEQVGKDGEIARDAATTNENEPKPSRSRKLAPIADADNEIASAMEPADSGAVAVLEPPVEAEAMALQSEASPTSASAAAPSGPRRKKSMREALSQMLDETQAGPLDATPLQ